MTNCSAFGCTSRSTEDTNLSFHRVPFKKAKKDLRKRWLENIRRDGNLPKDSSFYICSKHFKPFDCFQRDLKVRVYIKYQHNHKRRNLQYTNKYFA